MSKKYKEYSGLNLTEVASDMLKVWDKEQVFEKSISSREGKTPYVFFEGPPSANGLPGIHHVMARTIKDIFCRYKTLKGFQVKRKAGWDTHGLPIELGVEKELGITKEDIGTKITVEDYNKACREAVMRYTGIWNDLTTKMGYWVDMENPYVTYENKYIESVWWLLKQMYSKNLLYKGYTIQPYSPAAGTGLSSHELNQPGCYRNVKDTTVVAQFKVIRNEKSEFLFSDSNYEVFILAWTTTPWTLPSNTALAVGKNIEYVRIETVNQYSKRPVTVVLARNLQISFFPNKNTNEDELAAADNKYWEIEVSKYFNGERKTPPFRVLPFTELVTDPKDYLIKGSELVGIQYEQLLPYALPHENADKAFRVIAGDFVTTEDGTGIVHIAPTFGADDMRVAKEAGVPPMLVIDKTGKAVPLVDLQGRFRTEMNDDVFGLGSEYIKEEYLSETEKADELKKQQERLKSIIPKLDKYLSTDERIALKLKIENKAFKIEKYEHSYPHCWRTDKPVLYYPLDSWFIKVTDKKERMFELNKTINWKPASTGTGRFGNWLENANDWNLSRSRFWGIPLPIWKNEDGEEICIGSVQELKEECEKAVKAGVLKENPLKDFNLNDQSQKNFETFDLHKPYVDKIVLVSKSGKALYREADLIDVWFDSGAMPYAQWHYPFENKELIDSGKAFPADFIAEGVDQTRGWFYTLHAIATMCFDSVAYKNVVSNGLVLDKNGHKMSKRLGNAVDPFKTLETYGADATRWYMITNAQPWDNLKFDLEGISEVQRKFFRALYNTYSFFSLYANIDGFKYEEPEVPLNNRTNIDRWVLSKLATLVKEVNLSYENYEPTKAGRLIQNFVVDQLSNWYVRLCRRRFWKGEYTEDKIAAYQTLYTCLEVVSKLMSPIAPFYSDQLYCDLNSVTNRESFESVHLSEFPEVLEGSIDADFEERMDIAQKITSLILSLRKRENIRVRQPLQKIMVPALDNGFRDKVESVKEIILSEVNVKELGYIDETSNILIKKIKPNFKALGPKVGKNMKELTNVVNTLTQPDISTLERTGKLTLTLGGESFELELQDVEILSNDIPGWLVASEGAITVALDITISESLKNEGIARELINRVQGIRKDKGFEVTDKVELKIMRHEYINDAINQFLNYICSETLTSHLELVDKIDGEKSVDVEVEENIRTLISIEKINKN